MIENSMSFFDYYVSDKFPSAVLRSYNLMRTVNSAYEKPTGWLSSKFIWGGMAIIAPIYILRKMYMTEGDADSHSSDKMMSIDAV